MEEKRKPFLVFSMGMMKFLDSKGFKFFATKQDRDNPNRTIFIYDNTDALLDAVNQYKKKKQ